MIKVRRKGTVGRTHNKQHTRGVRTPYLWGKPSQSTPRSHTKHSHTKHSYSEQPKLKKVITDICQEVTPILECDRAAKLAKRAERRRVRVTKQD